MSLRRSTYALYIQRIELYLSMHSERKVVHSYMYRKYYVTCLGLIQYMYTYYTCSLHPSKWPGVPRNVKRTKRLKS